LLADKPQKTPGATAPQSVQVIVNPGNQNPGDWTAISFALKPSVTSLSRRR
jgi:hypothetical protein